MSEALFYLDTESKKWHEKIVATLPRVENFLRFEQELPELEWNEIFVPSGPTHLMQFWNWKVWCAKHKISLDLLMTIILRYYRRRRMQSKQKFSLALGLPVKTITSRTCHAMLIAELAKIYPNNEQMKAARSTVSYQPVRGVDFGDGSDIEGALDQYTAIMLQRQKDNARQRRPKRAGRWS